MISLLFEDDHIRVLYRPGTTPYSLVTFSVLGYKPAQLSFWAKRLCDTHDVTAIGVVAKAANWFPSRSMRQARPLIAPYLHQPVVSYGLSHGGYGALKYAALVGASVVIAICPQYSINPATLPIDPVYAAFFDPALHQGMEITRADQSGQVILIYDPTFRRDAKHADHILALGYGNTLTIPLRHVAHRLSEVLVDDAFGTTLIDAGLDPVLMAGLQPRLRRMRRQTCVFSLNLATRMLHYRKPAAAARLLRADAGAVRSAGEQQRYLALLSRAEAGAEARGAAGGHAPDAHEAGELAWELGKTGVQPPRRA